MKTQNTTETYMQKFEREHESHKNLALILCRIVEKCNRIATYTDKANDLYNILANIESEIDKYDTEKSVSKEVQ